METVVATMVNKNLHPKICNNKTYHIQIQKIIKIKLASSL